MPNKTSAKDIASAQRYYAANKQKIKAWKKVWQADYYVRNRAKFKAYREANKDILAKKDKARRAANSESLKIKRAIYRAKNIERIKLYFRERRAANREAYILRDKKYRESRGMALEVMRYKNDPEFRMSKVCRSRIWIALKRKGLVKSERTQELIGCSPLFMKEFLERQFSPEMNWGNWGTTWELDHIIPVSNFDLMDLSERKSAFHYSNCRPLLKSENRSKKDKLPDPHQALLI